MIPFHLTAFIRATLEFNERQKPAKSYIWKPSKILPNLHSWFHFSTKQISKLTFSTTALRYFKKQTMADMTPTFHIEEDEEPMATEPIYLSSDEREYSTPNTTPDHHEKCIYID